MYRSATIKYNNMDAVVTTILIRFWLKLSKHLALICSVICICLYKWIITEVMHGMNYVKFSKGFATQRFKHACCICNTFFYIESWDSSVGIMTRLQARHLTKRDSIPGRGRWFSCSWKRPDWHWGSPSLLFNTYLDVFLEVKRPRQEVNHLLYLVPRLIISGAISPRPCTPSGSAQGRIFIRFCFNI
jgi:hypothetical protein